MQGTTVRVIVGVFWLALLVVLGGFWGTSAARARGTAQLKPASQSVSPSSFERAVQPIDNRSLDQPEIDLFGNEIERAVSDYRVDYTGDIYEAHSPDTAITRLAAPSL